MSRLNTIKENFSYSKVNTYKQCPFKYKLQYVDKHYFYSDGVATLFGTAVHETEEAIANMLINKQTINYVTLKNNFIIKCAKIEGKFTDYNLPDKSGETYKQKANFYLNEGIFFLEKFMKDNPDLELVSAEEKFKLEYDNLHDINGSIDRLFHNKVTDEYLIQDIKTWSEEKKAIDELNLPLQFYFYSLAVKAKYNVSFDKIKCEYYLPLLKGKTFGKKAIDLKDDCDEALKANFNGILNKDFKPILSALCHWCSFSNTNPNQPEKAKNLCPYHSLWSKSGDNASDCIVSWHGLDKHEAALEEYKLKTQGGEK